MKKIPIFESKIKPGKKVYESQDVSPNSVRFWAMDYKQNPSKEEHKEMADVAKITDGNFQELDVWTSDMKIFAAGPDSFFKWHSENRDKYGDATEMFMDASTRYDDEWEIIEEVEDYYMKDEELFVKTDKDRELSYADWWAYVQEGPK